MIRIQCQSALEDEEIDEALLSGVKASDNEDGDLTDQIRVSSMSNFTEPGKRTITYAVFDKAGQAATLERTLEYTDYTSPQIQLTAPLRYSLEDMADVNLTENMSVEDCLDGELVDVFGPKGGYLGTAFTTATPNPHPAALPQRQRPL